MAKSTKISSDESDSINQSCTLAFGDLDNCSTQDACDYEQYFGHNLSDDSQDSTDARPKLRLNIASHLNDLSPASILSPVSELAMNIAKTKLVHTNGGNVTGKYDSSKSADLYFTC